MLVWRAACCGRWRGWSRYRSRCLAEARACTPARSPHRPAADTSPAPLRLLLAEPCTRVRVREGREATIAGMLPVTTSTSHLRPPPVSPPTQVRVREDQEAIIAGLSPSDFDCLLDLRPFMQVGGRAGGLLGGCWAGLGWAGEGGGPRSQLPLGALHAMPKPALARTLPAHPSALDSPCPPPARLPRRAALPLRGERGGQPHPRLPVRACHGERPGRAAGPAAGPRPGAPARCAPASPSHRPAPRCIALAPRPAACSARWACATCLCCRLAPTHPPCAPRPPPRFPTWRPAACSARWACATCL